MQCPGVDNRFDAMVRKRMLHRRSICHRTDDLGVGSGHDVQADRDVASSAEAGGEELAKPSR